MKPARLSFVALLLGFAPAVQAQFVWPTTGVIGSSFWTDRGSFYHKAIDINGSYGARVVASYDGKVLLKGRYSSADFYGNLVAIRHAAGYDTYYAHNSRFADIRVGQSVGQNQLISFMGNTGNAASVHVHFEVRRYNANIYSYAYQIFVPGSRGMRVVPGQKINHAYPGLDAIIPNEIQARRIDAATLNVRTGPGVSKSILGVAKKGQIFVRFKVDGDWSRIYFGGITGWIRTKDTAAAKNAATRKVTWKDATVRAQASVGSRELGKVRQGQIYVRIAGEGDFAKIFYRGGTGWVKTAALKIVKLD